ncbi:MAG: hypothetical protein Q8O33_17845 [Pseudomonadota bacterium]|nr:hypothetical protein [Pseudomonadota bacterium]
MTFEKKGDLIVETFMQHGRDGAPDVEVFRVHDIEGHTDYLRAGFEDYQERKLERQSKGRYTLEEAAMLIVVTG